MGMNTPKTPEELASAIEGVVAVYLVEAERVVQAALSRAFSKGSAEAVKRSRRGPASSPRQRQQGPRRSAEELAELCERLAAAVTERPGESMASFARQLGVSVRDLHRPMTVLKDKGRIRSVGQRQLTRYFPTSVSRARA
jgi:predicted transcriptional regulator